MEKRSKKLFQWQPFAAGSHLIGAKDVFFYFQQVRWSVFWRQCSKISFMLFQFSLFQPKRQCSQQHSAHIQTLAIPMWPLWFYPTIFKDSTKWQSFVGAHFLGSTATAFASYLVRHSTARGLSCLETIAIVDGGNWTVSIKFYSKLHASNGKHFSCLELRILNTKMPST